MHWPNLAVADERSEEIFTEVVRKKELKTVIIAF
jgi:hypothetical protein